MSKDAPSFHLLTLAGLSSAAITDFGFLFAGIADNEDENIGRQPPEVLASKSSNSAYPPWEGASDLSNEGVGLDAMTAEI